MSERRLCPGRPVLLAALPLALSLACSSPGEPRSSSDQARLESTTPSALSWVGSTQLAYDESPHTGASLPSDAFGSVPASFVVALNDLSVIADTYPAGAATTVEVFWANADYSSIGSAAMALASSTDGPYGDDDRFVGTIPGPVLPAGLAVHYWVRAADAAGNVLYDSHNGANYTLVPRALSVGWAGDLGAYDAQGGIEFYQVGRLFNSDLSTTVGCSENGPDDYSIQAIQVYVPGLTDEGYAGPEALAAGALIRAELWTDMRPAGWGAVPTTCRAGIGNNYVCNVPFTVFPSPAGCLPGGNVAAGEYQYKMRFSVDAGNTWYWVGSIDGNGGGSNLNVQYGPTCPFAENDPAGCTTGADAGN